MHAVEPRSPEYPPVPAVVDERSRIDGVVGGACREPESADRRICGVAPRSNDPSLLRPRPPGIGTRHEPDDRFAAHRIGFHGNGVVLVVRAVLEDYVGCPGVDVAPIIVGGRRLQTGPDCEVGADVGAAAVLCEPVVVGLRGAAGAVWSGGRGVCEGGEICGVGDGLVGAIEPVKMCDRVLNHVGIVDVDSRSLHGERHGIGRGGGLGKDPFLAGASSAGGGACALIDGGR